MNSYFSARSLISGSIVLLCDVGAHYLSVILVGTDVVFMSRALKIAAESLMTSFDNDVSANASRCELCIVTCNFSLSLIYEIVHNPK